MKKIILICLFGLMFSQGEFSKKNLEDGFYVVELYRINVLNTYFNNISPTTGKPLNISINLFSNGKHISGIDAESNFDVDDIENWDFRKPYHKPLYISGNKGVYLLDPPLKWLVPHEQLNNYQIVVQEFYSEEDIGYDQLSKIDDLYGLDMKKVITLGLKGGFLFLGDGSDLGHILDKEDFEIFKESEKISFPVFRYVYPYNPQPGWIFDTVANYDSGEDFLHFRSYYHKKLIKTNSADKFKHQTTQDTEDSLNTLYRIPRRNE